MNFSPAVYDLAPWSYSMANKAHTCPFAFHQQYVIKEKAKATLRIENQIGSAVHKILELCILGATIDSAYQKVIADGLLYDVEIAIYNYRIAIEEFLKGLTQFSTKFKVTKKYAEKKIGLTENFTITGFWNKKRDCLIRGAIDLLLFTRDNRAVIIDHKSGAKKLLSTYDPQGMIYSLFGAALEPSLRSARTAFHFVGADKNNKGTRTEWGPEYPVETIQTRFREDIIAWLNQAAERAQTGVAEKSWLCNFCGYQHVCPLKR